MKKEFDTIVIGGGTIGLSAAYFSSLKKKSTLLIEKKSSGHDLSCSSGHSRIFRIMYSEREMAQLSIESLKLWKKIEQESDKALIKRQDLIFLGLKNLGNTVEGDFDETDTVMKGLSIPYEEYNGKQIEKFGFQNIPQNYKAFIQKDSGIIDVKKSISCFKDLCAKQGVSFEYNKSAEIINADKDTVEIKCNSKTIKGKKLIIAVGTHTNELLKPLNILFNFKIWQMTIAYYKIKNPKFKMPLWYEFGDYFESNKSQRALFYGFPEFEKKGHVKISADYTNDIFDKFSLCTHKPDLKILEDIRKFVSERFPALEKKESFTKLCRYSMSSDYHMILDQLPNHENVAIFCGESGRAFKYTPIFGLILNNIVDGIKVPYSIDSLRISQNRNLFKM